MTEKDKGWFDEIYISTAPKIRRYAMSLYRAFPWLLDDPDDIVQEVYLCLYEKRDEINDTTNISAWLIKTAQNKTFDSYRQYQKRTKMIDDFADLDKIAMEKAQGEEVISLDTYIKLCEERIGKKNFEILRAHYIDKKPVKELAKEQGVAVTTMRVRIHRWKKYCVEVIKTIARSELMVIVGLLIRKA